MVGRSPKSAAPPPDPGKGTWLTQFTDLVMLLLTFFLMVFSMTDPQAEKWAGIVAGLSQDEEAKMASEPKFQDVDNVLMTSDDGLDLGYLAAVLRHMRADTPELETIRLSETTDQLVISFPDELLFASNNTQVKPEGQKALFALSGILRRFRNQIEIHGYSDPSPIRAGTYATNRALSIARAYQAAVVLRDNGYDRPIVVLGHGSAGVNQNFSAWSDSIESSRQRRVDIVIDRQSV